MRFRWASHSARSRALPSRRQMFSSSSASFSRSRSSERIFTGMVRQPNSMHARSRCAPLTSRRSGASVIGFINPMDAIDRTSSRRSPSARRPRGTTIFEMAMRRGTRTKYSCGTMSGKQAARHRSYF